MSIAAVVGAGGADVLGRVYLPQPAAARRITANFVKSNNLIFFRFIQMAGVNVANQLHRPLLSKIKYLRGYLNVINLHSANWNSPPIAFVLSAEIESL